MGPLRRARTLLNSDLLYEVLVLIWVALSPLAIARWVDGFEDPVSWAAFVAGVIGVFVGWLIVAPYQTAKARLPRSGA
jgi:purine-cytosine permease-like protein